MFFEEKLNPHYDFSNSSFLAEISKQDAFDAPGELLKMAPYQSGGGSVIESPWGSNRSIDAGAGTSDTIPNYLKSHGMNFAGLLNPLGVRSSAEPLEFCIKDLVVNPGNQLSLQRHRGREEYWIVKSGLLTVIVDGHQIDVTEGQGIFIPLGSTHCMNNKTDKPVHVEELQFGICREADNVRLLDATRDDAGNPKPRPTYPIRNEVEFRSAQLFARLAADIARTRGWAMSQQFQTLLTVQPV